MAAAAAEEMAPHVLLFPFPVQGHMPPVLKLAELLSLAGLRVTFLNTDDFHRRMLRHSRPALDRLSRRPAFRFRTVPDGFPDDHPRPALHFVDLEESLRTRSRDPYRNILLGAGDPDGWPPVSCVLADGALRLAVDVAEEVGIPVAVFRTGSACSVWAYHRIPDLIAGGELPFPEDADLDEIVRGVPGMEGFLRRRDLPSFCRSAAEGTFEFVSKIAANVTRGKALILNTFEAAEGTALSQIRSEICPATYAIGPLHSFPVGGGGGESPSSKSASIWEEDRACIAWLDAQPRRSVVYVSFGSFTVISREELVEFWHGLAGSGYRFLWVLRPGITEETPEAPAGLEAATRERGCVVGWAPQQEVLAHPAVGCFLTHSGWNSTLEGMTAGVPMLCWPFFSDQQTNSRFVGEVWRIGVDMKDKCGRDVVESMIRKVMEGEEAAELRQSAAEMVELAGRSVEEGGASYMDFQKLVQHIRSLSAEFYSSSRSTGEDQGDYQAE